jgi:hypothetical protein
LDTHIHYRADNQSFNKKTNRFSGHRIFSWSIKFVALKKGASFMDFIARQSRISICNKS